MDLSNLSITIDIDALLALGKQPIYHLLWYFFLNGGWVLFVLVIFWGLFLMFVTWRQKVFGSKQNYVFLAIDIPKQNLQSPKAVENIFSTLAGAHMPLEWEEEIFEGAYQLGFSFEIVGIDGYVQFVVRTPIQWRGMVESAFYAQYPDSEIVEVEDYTANVELSFPNDEYNLWGSDLKLITDYWYPIRSYMEFEHPLSKDIKDPMSMLLEVINMMKRGEQFWLQLLVYPTDVSWLKKGENALKKLIGQPIEEKKTFFGNLMEEPMKWVGEFSNQLFGGGEASAKEEKKERMSFLPPVEKIKAEGIARKLQKIGFKCKYRMIYLAKKEVFNKGIGVSGTFGAIKQYTDLHLNGFKPDKNKTAVRFPWNKKNRVASLQNAVLRAYKKRDSQTASEKFILNVEELATIYHFPFFETRGPLVKKIDSRKATAPVGLPVNLFESDEAIGFSSAAKQSGGQAAFAAGEKVPVVDYDDDYFEKRFAKDKTKKKDLMRKKKIVARMDQIEQGDYSPELPRPELPTPPAPAKPPRAPEENSSGRQPPPASSTTPTNLPFVE